MADDTYVLDLLVTGAEAVSVNDDGTGIDTIRVTGVYAATIDIDLARTVISGIPMNAGSRYFSADNNSHQLVIFGSIENAFGSNGCDDINGNTLANLLSGDQKPTGAGLSDTLQGGGGDDSLYGGAGDDQVSGGADDDVLWGDAGNDVIDAGSGRDTVIGGAGADLLNGGGDIGDTLSYATSRRGVVVSLQDNAVTLAHGGDAEGDQIEGFTNVTGSAAKDRITMVDKTILASDNQIYGGGGADRIALGGGDDVAYGGTGNDGVKGELGDDSLSGDSGSDKLTGGYGQDVLTGGSEADRFIFNSILDSSVSRPDVVTDFNSAELDSISLKTIDADSGLAGNQTFSLIDGDFTHQAGQLRTVVMDDTDLQIFGDTDGDGQADFLILLRDCLLMAETNFIL